MLTTGALTMLFIFLCIIAGVARGAGLDFVSALLFIAAGVTLCLIMGRK